MTTLRICPENTSTPIDFRDGRWGHRLHSSTFTGMKPHKVRRWSFLPWPMVDEPASVRRVSFMVHTSDTPAIGREVIWNAAGGPRTGRIYDVEFCHNPRDMMTLFVVIHGDGKP
jgi:hypothetical protein